MADWQRLAIFVAKSSAVNEGKRWKKRAAELGIKAIVKVKKSQKLSGLGGKDPLTGKDMWDLWGKVIPPKGRK